MSTGSGVPGSCHDGSSTAVRSARSPARCRVIRGVNPGGSANEVTVRSSPPAGRTVVTVPSASSDCLLTTSVPPTSRPPCTPGSGREAAQPVRGGPGPQRDRDRVVGGAEQHGVPVDVEHGADLQGRRGDRLTVDEQAARGPVVGDPQQGAGRRAGRHAGDDLDPVPVGVLVHEGGGAGGRVDLQHAQRALVARLDHDQQLLGGPHDVRQVLVAPGVPRDVDARAVEPDDDERHQRVRRTRRRVGDDRGLPVGVRGVRDVPAADRCVVDPGDEQRPAVRGPPVPAHPVHLLGRDEVGEAVGHRGALGRGEDRRGGRRRGRGRAARRR